MKRIQFVLTALAAMFTGLAVLADETISADTQLAADRTVSGTLYLADGATLDLNGHNLTVNAIAPSDVDDVPGYKFLEYIQSSGTQWLCSGYTPASSDRVEMKVELTSLPGNSAWWIFFCSRGTSNTNSFMAGIQGATKFRVDHQASGTTTGVTYSPGFAAGTLYEISVDGDSGACKVNGSKVLTTVTGAYETASGPFSILGAHTYGAGLAEQNGTKLSNIPSCRIYSFQVYDKNGDCKCDMVPAKRTSDGAIGMYDKASGRNLFLENYGTGSFVAGPRAVTVAITNSSATVSALRVNVSEGIATTNADVVVSGNVRFVKDGDGTYFVTKKGQSYTAGTDIDAGTIRVNGRGTDGLLGTVAGNLVRNDGFDDEGTTSGTGNSGNWNYASASGFNLPDWDISNNSCMGLSKASGVWVASGINVGKYAFYMRTSDTDNKGHTGDITLEQGGLGLTRGRWRIAYDYATRKNAAHYPVTNRCNIVKGNIVREVGVTVATSAQQNAFASAEWFFEIGEDEEGEYSLQFLQKIIDNGSSERTTILDNIVVEKVSAADIVVNSGATLELASGARDFSDYQFVMNGGTLLNSSGAGTAALVTNVRLLDDSTWENTSNGGFIAPDSGETLLDLGGKTLSVASENSQTLYFKNTTITNGTLALPQHLFVNFEGSGVDASTAKIVSENLFKVNAPTVLGDFEERRATGGSHTTSKTLTVCGTFKPVTTAYPALTLRDGATLDLSERSSSISVASPKLTFENGATIAIRLGCNHVDNPLVSWTTAPANLDTLTFVKAAGESGYSLKVKDNGLYAVRGLMIIVK
ncbi:MAG: hypothetical protein J5985_06740 [Kiritimatiellae bacterium]|nr:hypothetical protein [Kiritimatiellia bacterium]